MYTVKVVCAEALLVFFKTMYLVYLKFILATHGKYTCICK